MKYSQGLFHLCSLQGIVNYPPEIFSNTHEISYLSPASWASVMVSTEILTPINSNKGLRAPIWKLHCSMLKRGEEFQLPEGEGAEESLPLQVQNVARFQGHVSVSNWTEILR